MPRELVEVAPGVLVATSRTMTTTSTAVVRDGDALLVDPAWHPDELVGLADALDARGLRVVGGIATHAHHDHLLWHPRLGDAPRQPLLQPVKERGEAFGHDLGPQRWWRIELVWKLL